MVKNLLFIIILQGISTTILAQIGIDFPFWKGILSSSNENEVFAVVKDTIYEIDDGFWVNKGYLNSGTNTILDLKVNRNVIWVFYPTFLKYSNDKGKTWNIMSIPTGANGSGGKFYGDYIYLKNGGSIYRKDIRSVISTWEKIYENGYYDFAITEDSTIFISINDFNDLDYEYYKIFKSKDLGITWTETNWTSEEEFSTVCTLESRNNKLFAGTYWGGLYYTSDGGNTWGKSKGLPTAEDTPGGGRGVSDIYLNAENMVIVLVRDQISTSGFYVSYDDGVNFVKLKSGLTIWTEEYINGFVFHEDKFFINADNRGFFISPDKGKSWKDFNNGKDNIKPHHVQKLQMDSDGTLWALMSEPGIGPRNTWGILKSNDNGVTWIEADSNLFDKYMTFEDLLITPNGKALASNYTPGFFNMSVDKGSSWVVQSLPQPCETCTYGIVSTLNILGSDQSNDTIFAGTYWDGVFRSYNSGLNWEKLSNGIPSGSGVSNLFISKDTLYAIFSNQLGYDGIYKSINLGDSWIKISSKMLERLIKQDNILWGFDVDNVYKSIDNGFTWTEFSANLPSYPGIRSMLIINNTSKSSNKTLLIGTYYGLYISDLLHDDWKKVSNNTGQSLLWDAKNKKIIVGSESGVTIQSIDLGIISNIKESNQDKINDIYLFPNPAEDIVYIKNVIDAMSKAEIYDIRGILVKKVQNESKIDISDLSYGVYYVRISNSLGKEVILKFVKK